MNFLMILLFNLCGQVVFDGIPPAQSLRDKEFQRVQIEWIAGNVGGTYLDRMVNHRQNTLIAQLDCDYQAGRDAAKVELEAMGESAFIALTWGLYLGNTHVRHECNLLLIKIYKCQYCNGSGSSRSTMCAPCYGTGDQRFSTATTYTEFGESATFLVPLDLFPQNRSWKNGK